MPILSAGRSLVGLTTLALVIGACSLNPKQDPSQFYVLTPADETEATSSPGPDKVFGVGPVRFPTYLDRPQMVTRLSEVQVSISEYERWAEPPQSSFASVLARNLELALATSRVETFPWIAGVDYSVRVSVERFERDASGTAELRCHWAIIDFERVVVLSRESIYREAAADATTDAAVAALSRTVQRLSADIAAAVRQLPND